MKCYELLFVVKPTLTEEEVKGQLDFMKGVLEKNGCEIESVKEMGVRKLAYEIEKHERGHYFVVYYKTETSAIEEILRNLRLSETIIRFLNLKFENKKEVANWEKLAKAPVKSDKRPVRTEAAVTPKTEAVKAETPKVEEAKTEIPKTEEIKTETPKAESVKETEKVEEDKSE